jgi:transposase-like protein
MKYRVGLYRRHRFPPEIIQHAVWLYHRFNLSHRDIEDLVARRELLPTAAHDTRRYANNRAELSHQLTRARERGMRHHSSPEQAQRFLSGHAVIYSLCNLQRHLASAAFYRFRRARAFKHWSEAVAA